MKTSTLNKRLLRLDVSKTSIAYQIAKELTGLYFMDNKYGPKTIRQPFKTYHIDFTGLIRPCYVSGSGRFASNQDHTLEVKYILDMLKIKYEFGNDAPRGGLTGNYIKILTKLEV
jgi:hypothetical protein